MLPANQTNSESYVKISHSQTKDALHCPITGLPEDLLRHIFISAQGSTKFNIYLSHVCRSWREIALDSALLWSKISYAINPDPDMIRTFLNRSKDAPLQIDLTVYSEQWPRLFELVDILLPRISQLKTLAFTSPPPLMRYFLQHFSANPSNEENGYWHDLHAPNLERLFLNTTYSGLREDYSIDTGNWFAGRAPKLQTLDLLKAVPHHQPLLENITSLTLHDYIPQYIPLVISQCRQISTLSLRSLPSPGPLSIPTLRTLLLFVPPHHTGSPLFCLTPQSWNGITVLTIIHVELGVLLQILRQTPRLQFAKFTGIPRSPNSPELEVAPLKCLEFLDITLIPSVPRQKVMQYFQMPVLEELRLEYLSVTDYLSQARPPLKRLTLRRLEPKADQLQKILAELPLLEELSTVKDPGFGKTILQVISRHPELCPRLRTFEIDRCDKYSKQELEKLIRSRRQSIQ